MGKVRHRKTIEKWKHDAIKVILSGCVLSLVPNTISTVKARNRLISPLADTIVVEKEVPIEVPAQNIDTWIAQYSKQYANASYPESYLKYQLHCLANKESGHRYNDHKNCGDSGKACGLYQYHEPTWIGFQKIMGLDYVDRWDNERQVQVTAWALSDGRHQNWGPMLRGQCW